MDGEVFGVGEKWYYFPCFSRRRKSPEKFPVVATITSGMENSGTTVVKENP